MALHLGIDLGTSNSAVFGNRAGELRLYKTADGTDVLPSVISIDRRGHRRYGNRAYEQLAMSPENVGAGFKRLMGTSTPIRFAAANVTMSPEECSAEILRTLVGQALSETGEREIDGAVVTIPAAFNQMQSEATIRAANAAGLEQVGLLQEPIAAAMAAMVQAKGKSGVFLVYDLGAGTFDLALVQSTAGSVSVLAHEGINMLGGRDFDTALLNQVVRPWLFEHFDLPDDFQKDPKLGRITRIARIKVEQAKIALSSTREEIIFASDEDIRATDRNGREIYLEVPLRRETLEDSIRPRIEETLELSRKLLGESGFRYDDIDRVVLVGGPSKMPLVRRMIGDGLGIQVDMQTDPMVAVAQGAAIFAESREWLAGATQRKGTRGTVAGNGAVRLHCDFPARVAEAEAKIRIRVENGAEGIQVEVHAHDGTSSARHEVRQELLVDLRVPHPGENRFVLRAYTANGRPLPEAGLAFVIVRTHATAAAIPATHTIAVKLQDQADESARNILDTLVAKGEPLPAKGTTRFRSARDVRRGQPGYIELELYQQVPGVPEPELNLFVGAFRIEAGMLPDGARVRRGDDVVVHWNVDDNGLLRCGIELPAHGQTFETARFYADTVGHRNFEGEDGVRFARTMLEQAEQEFVASEDALEDLAIVELALVRDRLDRLRTALEEADDADALRSASEEARLVRQELSRLRHLPEHRGAILRGEIGAARHEFREITAGEADPTATRRFQQLLDGAEQHVEFTDASALDEAERLLEQARSVLFREMMRIPSCLVGLFRACADEAHLTVDKSLHRDQVATGLAAIRSEAWDELRQVLGQLSQNRVRVAAADRSLSALAGLMRA